MKKRVLVAMSGGVDSSVVAYLLQKRGYDVTGITMCLGISDTDDDKTKCCGTNAIKDARDVCMKLSIPHYVLDFSRDMEYAVIQNFISEYQHARTPNPCIRCNEYLKFGKLLMYTRKMGFNFLATGHYAKIKDSEAGYFLQRPKDKKKDQTYFLYCIKRNVLPYILFPLADYTKDEARRIAREGGLSVSNKPQSQDICFVSGINYKEFILRRTGYAQKGPIIDLSGKQLGQHNGIINYTRGQRRGLGVAMGRPFYVVGFNVGKNQVIIGENKNLQTRTLMICNVNRLVDEFPKKVYVKVRYTHREALGTVNFFDNETARIDFDESQGAITPGQAAVLYNGDIVLGGGVIG